MLLISYQHEDYRTLKQYASHSNAIGAPSSIFKIKEQNTVSNYFHEYRNFVCHFGVAA